MGLGGMIHEEDQHDLDVLKVLAFIDNAVANSKNDDVQSGLTRLRQLGGRNALENIIKLKEPQKRALGVLGYRVLPVANGWADLQILVVDPSPIVRRQVMFYAARQPQGIDIDNIKMSLQDSAPEVRAAAVTALIHVAKKPAVAGDFLKKRLQSEKDPTVIRALRIGLTALGLPSQ